MEKEEIQRSSSSLPSLEENNQTPASQQSPPISSIQLNSKYSLGAYLDRNEPQLTVLGILVTIAFFANRADPYWVSLVLAFLPLTAAALVFVEVRQTLPYPLGLPTSFPQAKVRLQFIAYYPTNRLVLFSMTLDLGFLSLILFTIYSYPFPSVIIGSVLGFLLLLHPLGIALPKAIQRIPYVRVLGTKRAETISQSLAVWINFLFWVLVFIPLMVGLGIHPPEQDPPPGFISITSPIARVFLVAVVSLVIVQIIPDSVVLWISRNVRIRSLLSGFSDHSSLLDDTETHSTDDQNYIDVSNESQVITIRLPKDQSNVTIAFVRENQTK